MAQSFHILNLCPNVEVHPALRREVGLAKIPSILKYSMISHCLGGALLYLNILFPELYPFVGCKCIAFPYVFGM